MTLTLMPRARKSSIASMTASRMRSPVAPSSPVTGKSRERIDVRAAAALPSKMQSAAAATEIANGKERIRRLPCRDRCRRHAARRELAFDLVRTDRTQHQDRQKGCNDIHHRRNDENVRPTSRRVLDDARHRDDKRCRAFCRVEHAVVGRRVLLSEMVSSRRWEDAEDLAPRKEYEP